VFLEGQQVVTARINVCWQMVPENWVNHKKEYSSWPVHRQHRHHC